MSNLYAILGFDPTARDRVTTADVKRAYRQEALKWHPDKHPAETREQAEAHFKDLAHAFEILSDDAKRRLYDQGGMAAVERGYAAAPPMRTSGEEAEARHHSRAYTHAQPSRERGATHRGGFAFRDPFEIFDAMFRDMNRMMGSAHASRSGFGFGGGGVFDDPFFHSPFSADPFFGSPFGGRSSGMFFGPSLLSAFDTGSTFGPSMPQRPPQSQSGTQTQMFSFTSSTGFGGNQLRQGTSVTVETRIENGQRVTRTVRRTYMPDGTVREEVSGPPPVAAAAAPRVAATPAVAPVAAPQPFRVAPVQLLRTGSLPPQQRPPLVAPVFQVPQAQPQSSFVGARPPSRPSVSSAGGTRSLRSATSGPGAARTSFVSHAAYPHFVTPSVAVPVGGRH